jgi:hypothetical protein
MANSKQGNLSNLLPTNNTSPSPGASSTQPTPPAPKNISSVSSRPSPITFSSTLPTAAQSGSSNSLSTTVSTASTTSSTVLLRPPTIILDGSSSPSPTTLPFTLPAAVQSGSNSSTSATTSTTSSTLEDKFPEAKVSLLGLPVHWRGTAKAHQMVIFDPATGKWKRMIDKKIVDVTPSPKVGFIMSTTNNNPIPGTDTPASVRFTRYKDLDLRGMVIENPDKEYLAPCLAHGDFVLVGSLEADHAQAKKVIMDRQDAFVKRLNEDQQFANDIMKLKGIEKFFKKVGNRYYGTLFFYEVYFNALDNIWLICDACNAKKRDADAKVWLKDKWLYGPEFLKDLDQNPKDLAIIQKTKSGEGLAQAAINWFWEKHARYISVAKELAKDIVFEIQAQNKKVEKLKMAGKLERTERKAAGLKAKMELLKKIVKAHIGMPPTSSETGNSSDEDDNLTLSSSCTTEEYKKAAVIVADRIAEFLAQNFADAIEEQRQQRLQNSSNTTNNSFTTTTDDSLDSTTVSSGFPNAQAQSSEIGSGVSELDKLNSLLDEVINDLEAQEARNDSLQDDNDLLKDENAKLLQENLKLKQELAKYTASAPSQLPTHTTTSSSLTPSLTHSAPLPTPLLPAPVSNSNPSSAPPNLGNVDKRN